LFQKRRAVVLDWHRFYPLKSDRTVRIEFVGAEVAAENEVTMDLRTGSGVGLALAALFWRLRGSSKSTFVDGGRKPRLSVSAENGVNVFGRADAAQTIRIVTEDNCRSICCIWSGLFPRVTQISPPSNCTFFARTFANF
jgi:hypothetical protein